MKAKRFILLFICLSLILITFASCLDDDDSGENKFTNKPVYDDSSRETTSDCIPDDFSLDGKKVGILYGAHIEKEVIGDDETEDIVYSRIYERNQKVEARLNCKLNMIPGGSLTDWQAFSPDLLKRVTTMDSSFWIVISSNNTILQKKMFNYFHNLNESTYIDVDREWWYQDAISECSVDGYNYRFLYGDINISAMGSNGAILYNKDYYGQYIDPGNPEGLYDFVYQGTWTFQKFIDIVTECDIDLPGDNDIYGFTLTRYGSNLGYFAEGCGIEFYTRDEYGEPSVTIGDGTNRDKAVKFTEMLYSLVYENPGTQELYYPNMVGSELDKPMFTDGRYMFSITSISALLDEELRAMDYDFGILPFPKWNSEQEYYITSSSNGSALVGCTKNTPYETIIGDASAVIEALCSESYRSVILAFYENALQRAYSRDDTSARMIDIICARDPEVKSIVTKNMLGEFSTSVNNIGSIFSTAMWEKSKDFQYYYESISYEKALENLYNEWVEAAYE